MDARHKTIKDFWLKGFTAKDIAIKLGATKNAVIGVIYRMRVAGQLSVRESDERMYSIRSETLKLEKERLASVEDVMRETPYEKEKPAIRKLAVLYTPPAQEPASKEAIKFDNLTNKSCRFIINNGDPKDFIFCGKPKEKGSYCKEHSALCYYRPVRGGNPNANVR